MPVSERWGNEAQTVVIVQASGEWTWEDLFASADRVRSMRGEDRNPDLIFDFTDSTATPRNPIAQLPKIAEMRRQNRGRLVVVGVSSTLGKIATEVFNKLYHGMLRAKTLDEAYALLELERPGLQE